MYLFFISASCANASKRSLPSVELKSELAAPIELHEPVRKHLTARVKQKRLFDLAFQAGIARLITALHAAKLFCQQPLLRAINPGHAGRESGNPRGLR